MADERIDALERTIGHLATIIDAQADSLLTAYARLLALEAVLDARGIVSTREVEARRQEMELGVEATGELAPEYEEFRRLRDQIRRAEDDASA
jgi:hypothetical protein